MVWFSLEWKYWQDATFQKQKPKQLFYFTGFSNAMKLNICIISSFLRSLMIFWRNTVNDNRTLTLLWRALFCMGLGKGGGTRRGRGEAISISKYPAGNTVFLKINSLGCWNKGIIVFKFTSLNIEGVWKLQGICLVAEFFFFFPFFTNQIVRLKQLLWKNRKSKLNSN